MKVDVVIESKDAVIEKATVHVSKEKAENRVKKWFRKHYPSPMGKSKDYHFKQWKNGTFEFSMEHEISVFETRIIGSDGADLCKHCRERKI